LHYKVYEGVFREREGCPEITKRCDMKKSAALFFSAVVLILMTSSVVSSAEVIKLKSANYLPPTHKMSLLGQKFCEEVNKRSNGRVEITYYPGGTVLSPAKMYNGVVTGIADMGFSHIGYTRGRFPVMEVFDLPLGFPSGYVAAQVSNDFYNKFKPSEWDNVHVLYLATSGPLIIQTVNKPVKTLQDLKGLKIRATGATSDVVKALGALPVPLEMPDVYESLRRAVIDGVMVDLSTFKYWKFAEVEKYATASWQLGTGITFYFVINKEKWNSLPTDIQKIFTDVSFEIMNQQAALWNEMDIEGSDLFKSTGGQILTLTDAEAARWVKAVEPVIGAYKKDMVSKGHKASDVDSWVKYIKERIEYWKKEEKKRAIPAPF
jgi:TRAP-type C4-dicarboxylate transport system substrate-binding protein